ncbi:MAG: radical SAM peptide maturase [Lentimicrobium sp.]|uniref:radical SAM peptide maturase n=1 Tax=Lentimicrobium sp. TaxID=2034841 RepID=UPI0025E8FF95|nr:radical SAM peptide maturase [Lentimicrobium sp.]MCO5257827.1 radical SAM peptide maturase [Lentimicrobium sp.]
MIESITYKTKSDSSYFYSINNSYNYFIHPLINYFFEKDNNVIGEKSYQVFFNNKNRRIIVNEVAYDSKEFEYYYSKYIHMLNNHIFEALLNSPNRYNGIISPKTIEMELANLQSLVFEITEKCNLNCLYCGYGKLYNNSGDRKRRVISFDKIKLLFEYLQPYWDDHPFNNSINQVINIGFYGGEPLLYFDLIEQIVILIQSLNLKSKTFIFRMTTNGVLLDRYIDKLVNYNFHISVSIDGNETNHSYRAYKNGKNSFSDVYENLKRIQSSYPDYFSNNVELISVIHDRNSMQSVHEFLYREFTKITSAFPLNTSGINQTKLKQFNHMFNNINNEIISDDILKERFIGVPKVRLLADYLVYNSSLFFKTYRDLFINERERVRIPTGTCIPFSKKLFVSAGGKILACEKIGHEFELGHITEKQVILNIDEVCKKFNTYIDSIRQSCNNCYFSEMCLQCIYQLEKSGKQNFNCKVRGKSEFSKYLSSVFSTIEENPELVGRIYNEIVIH